MSLAEHPGCNDLCNACHYKTLTYAQQLERKQSWAEKNLERWAKALSPIRAAPEDERLAYRSKSWLRSSYQNGTLSFGMLRAQQNNGQWDREFISWDTCPIHSLHIQKMIVSLKEELAHADPDYCRDSLFGVWMGTPHLVVVARDPLPDSLRSLEWGELLVYPFDRAWFHRTHQVGKKVFQHREFERLSGPPTLIDRPIQAFRQIAQTLLHEARELAVSSLLDFNPSLVVDLYCGTGDLSSLLPPSVNWVGIELSLDAATYANHLRPSRRAVHEAFVGSVEERLNDPRFKDSITGPYSIFVNPPRPGLSPKSRERLVELLCQKPASRFVYLSCSASSLSRDLKYLEENGYRVQRIQPYDFFPQTEHFETLALLAPASSKK